MKNTINQFLLFIAMLVFVGIGQLSAQDKIHFVDGKIVNGNVTEIDDDNIKYFLEDQQNHIIYSVDKAKIKKIEFSDGRVEEFEVNIFAPTPQAIQRKQALKMSFLSPLFGHLSLSYERLMKPGQNMELGLRIIGIGTNRELNFANSQSAKRDGRGIGLVAGYKFIKVPNQYVKGLKPSHLMRGAYFKPSLELGYFSENYIKEFETDENGTIIFREKVANRDIFHWALMLGLGTQTVLSNRFVVDFGVNVGLGGDNADGRDLDDLVHNNFGYTRFGKSEVGLAVGAGIRIGFLF